LGRRKVRVRQIYAKKKEVKEEKDKSEETHWLASTQLINEGAKALLMGGKRMIMRMGCIIEEHRI